MDNTTKNKVNWQSVVLYYAISCAISWPFFWWRDRQPASWQQLQVPGFIKTWSYMWGPGLAALICLFLFQKSHKAQVTLYGSSLNKSVLFYALPILLLTIPGVEGQNMNPHVAPLALGLLGFVSILGEELGWRGFLQDALRPLPPVKRYTLIGVLWELWHFTNRVSHGDPLHSAIRVSIFMVALVLISSCIGTATDRSKSLVVAVTLHAWIDILAEFNQAGTWAVFAVSLVWWGYLLWQWDKRPWLSWYKQQKS